MRTPASLRRQAALVLSAADWLLERPARSVLDVGCGEGDWRRALEKLRPGIRYVGVDPSPYVLTRFADRGIRHGAFDRLAELPFRHPLM